MARNSTPTERSENVETPQEFPGCDAQSEADNMVPDVRAMPVQRPRCRHQLIDGCVVGDWQGSVEQLCKGSRFCNCYCHLAAI